MARVLGDVADVGAEADHRRLVADVVDVAQHLAHDVGVAHVADPHVGAVGDPGRAAVVRGGVQDVEHAHLVAALEQLVDDERADEAEAPGDEHAHGRRG